MTQAASTNGANQDNVLSRVPPFPTALIAILHACAEDEPDVAGISRAVATEEILAAKVIAAANASLLTPCHAVRDVPTAVALLGAHAVRGMATSYYMAGTFPSAFGAGGLNREALWRHNLAVAAASSGAAGPGRERGDAYFAGLMHDVGKMVFTADLGVAYLECLTECALCGDTAAHAEQDAFGIDHAELGARAAEQWNFAPDVVEAIRSHHQVLGAGRLPPLASHVLVGNQVGHDMGFSSLGAYCGAGGATRSRMAASIGTGIMSRARWALTNEMPRIEVMLQAMVC